MKEKIEKCEWLGNIKNLEGIHMGVKIHFYFIVNTIVL